MTNEIAGILLAAGQSIRFGDNKLLQTLPDNNAPVAVQTARHLLEALPDSVAVVREDDQRLKPLLLDTGIRVIDNPGAALGMSSSIRCGVEAAGKYFPDVKGWVIVLADMPYIPPQIIKQVADAISQGALLAAPEYNKRRGHPVGFSKQLGNELLNLNGDAGAKTVVKKHRDYLQLIEVTSRTILHDIDRPHDVI
ncbi:nucleotidyltransferase family protein [Kaarinaea lacus]